MSISGSVTASPQGEAVPPQKEIASSGFALLAMTLLASIRRLLRRESAVSQ